MAQSVVENGSMLYRVVGEGLSDKVMLEQRFKNGKEQAFGYLEERYSRQRD